MKDPINLFTGETVTAGHTDRLGRPLTPWGAEIPDPVPIAPPVGYRRQPTMVEHIRNMVRSERLRQEAEAAGMESFEESEDFEIDGEDADPASPWENEFDPPVNELREAVEADKAKRTAKPKPPSSPSPEGSPEPSPAPSETSGN